MKDEQFDEKNRLVDEQAEDTPKAGPEESTPAQEMETAEQVPDLSATDEMPAEKLVEEIQSSKPHNKKTPNRRLRYGGMAVAVTALVAVGVVLLNVLVGVLYGRFPLRLDMTSDGRFSISQETEDMIAAVDRPVEIVAFFREKDIEDPTTTVTQLNTTYKELHETWRQYELQSNGKVTVRYVDLTQQPTLITEYRKYGDVQEGSILFRSGEGDSEKYRLRNINDFFTFETDSYGYSITSFTSLVETMTASCVNAVISDKDLEVMLLTGHEENEMTVSALQELYEFNGYTVNQINLASAQEIGENVTTAIVAAPASDFSDAEITRLRDWLTNDGKLGRNLMVVVNSLATSKDCPNLYEFLNDGYQIEVTDNQVVETEPGRAYAGYPQIIYGDLPESPFQEEAMEAGVLDIMPRQLLLKAGTDTEQTLYNIPLMTFPESSRLLPILGGEDAQYEEAEEYPVAGMGLAVNWTYDNSGDESVLVQTNVVVCNQGLVDGLTLNSRNEEVLLDAMNYINGNEDSVDILGKDLSQVGIGMNAGTANVLGIVLTVVLPVGLLIICLVVFLRRRHL